MKSAVLKVAAVAAFTMLAGCQDLKPLQAEVDNLKQQVSRLQADLDRLSKAEIPVDVVFDQGPEVLGL